MSDREKRRSLSPAIVVMPRAGKLLMCLLVRVPEVLMEPAVLASAIETLLVGTLVGSVDVSVNLAVFCMVAGKLVAVVVTFVR